MKGKKWTFCEGTNMYYSFFFVYVIHTSSSSLCVDKSVSKSNTNDMFNERKIENYGVMVLQS